MYRSKSVDVHQFAMVPKADIPRSRFAIETTHKTTFDAGYLIPVYLDEVLPGDSFSVHMTAFARMSTPLYPLMDNLHLDSFFFFIPNRLTWPNWKKFMGEQATPASSISYTIPQMVMPANGAAINSLADYFGLPTVGQVNPGSGVNISVNSLYFRAYNLCWNEWFRDENLQDSVVVDQDDGPDTYADYVLLRRGKRHDYFTSALPWPQKGNTAVTLPLGTSAPITTAGAAGDDLSVISTSQSGLAKNIYSAGGGTPNVKLGSNTTATNALYADLSAATAATINQLRQSFQIQKLLERDARGGTRYTEIIRAHFGVVSPDARLQRPEYLGGGSTAFNISEIAQTSGTSASGTTTPLGQLGAKATAIAGGHGFTQGFTEHGIILGLVSVRADLTYQQGLRKMWSRSTRYDFYFPAFAMLGEQSILSKEIYCDGQTNDGSVFGYQERWAEMRYNPAMITGLFRSTASGTLDGWHAAQKFTARPTLNTTFIQDTPPIDRILAVSSQTGKQFYFDSFFKIRATRPMPLYSVPGLIDHF